MNNFRKPHKPAHPLMTFTVVEESWCNSVPTLVRCGKATYKEKANESTTPSNSCYRNYYLTTFVGVVCACVQLCQRVTQVQQTAQSPFHEASQNLEHHA
jgi:hypothetical protein